MLAAKEASIPALAEQKLKALEEQNRLAGKKDFTVDERKAELAKITKELKDPLTAARKTEKTQRLAPFEKTAKELQDLREQVKKDAKSLENTREKDKNMNNVFRLAKEKATERKKVEATKKETMPEPGRPASPPKMR